MATSDKSSKSANQNKSGTDTGNDKKPATSPVVPSQEVEAGKTVVSRIPPSQPIDSGLVGESDSGIAAAEPKFPASRAKADTPDPANAAQKTGAETASAEPSGSVPSVPARKPDDAKVTSSAPPRDTQPVQVKKTGFWPTAFGGVVAAGLGAAAAIYALPYINPPAEPAPAFDADAVQSEAVAAATEATRNEVGAIREDAVTAATDAGREAGAEAALQAMTEMSQGADTTAEVQAAIQSQEERLAALEAVAHEQPAVAVTPTPESQTGAAEDQPDLAAEIASLRQQIDAQQQTIAELSARPQVDPEAVERVQSLAANAEQIRSEIEAAATQAQESLSSVQSEADAAMQRAQAVASVAALGAALERGGSPDEAVRQLEESGVEVPEPLAQEDLPTLVQIQMGYDAVARDALKASLQEGGNNDGALSAVGNFLRVLTGARSVQPREGTDPDAILSRSGALVEQGDLPAALEELNALPQAGRDAMSDWIGQVEAYLAAENALNDVAQSLN
ncbi:mitofilin family membrane protein [Paracoccus aerodenitrificans]|uniref:mitofilin family membrane protein n=1 Tax=Paracoccus aerodenitrificans TaxID=3017781 RepID=UPI0022F06661|nr:mitofilin family membrane protein [Paracoccus aerodenitrificans]WBU64529.1 mitofilin family membrane protein [Paracoccus aerodenitrificans]